MVFAEGGGDDLGRVSLLALSLPLSLPGGAFRGDDATGAFCCLFLAGGGNEAVDADVDVDVDDDSPGEEVVHSVMSCPRDVMSCQAK